MTRKVFVDGDRWMAADAQLVMDQAVMVFGDIAARDAQIPTPSAGMTCYISATNTLYVYRSGAWVEWLSSNASSLVPASEWPLPADWTADTAAPSLGNGTMSGYYARVGATHRATLAMSFGTGTTYGTGAWKFRLPRACGNTSYVLGYGYYRLGGTGDLVPVLALRLDGTTMRLIPMLASNGATPVGSATGAWANGGVIRVALDYF